MSSSAIDWQRIDATQTHDRAACLLAFLAEMTDAHKRASIQALALQSGQAAIDVGCGLGDDARRLADIAGPGGRVVGVDLSADLLGEARRRHQGAESLEFRDGDARALPFADGSFDGARSERVLQHIEGPAVAVRELARVVGRGGRVVALEPDWRTLAFSGQEAAVGQAVARHAVAHIRNPAAGCLLAGWFAAADLVIERVEALPLLSRSFATSERLCRLQVALEQLEPAAARQWRAERRREEAEGSFICAMLGVMVVGTRRR
ncbi:MAG: methyltransferase domain-containing protein [Solirubrobacterales bacterium]|nr:methyltransferase domain-containing protein [Solirubrobacterales bacterium]